MNHSSPAALLAATAPYSVLPHRELASSVTLMALEAASSVCGVSHYTLSARAMYIRAVYYAHLWLRRVVSLLNIVRLDMLCRLNHVNTLSLKIPVTVV
jgi:hypothetical protein